MSEVTNAPTAAAPAPAASTPAAPAMTAAPVAPTPVLPHGQRLYEAMWLVDVNTARENFGKVMSGIKELIEKSGGAWLNGDKWEERRLAYPIKKRKRGLYIISHFSLPTESMAKLERNIQISDVVLRALITKDEDGMGLVPVVRGIEDDDLPGGMGGGERRFFGGEGGGGRDRGERGERSERGGGERGGGGGGRKRRD